MPIIAMFYGIVILMYYMDNKKHKLPRIHVRYQDEEAVFAIPSGKLLEGKFRQVKENWWKHGLKFIKMT
jgi:hypothetical protein